MGSSHLKINIILFCELINLFSHHADDELGIGVRSASSAMIAEVNDVLPLLDGIGIDNLGGSV